MYIFGHWVCCIIITKVNTATEVQRFAKHHSNKNRLKSHKYLTNNQFNKRYINHNNKFKNAGKGLRLKNNGLRLKTGKGFRLKTTLNFAK